MSNFHDPRRPIDRAELHRLLDDLLDVRESSDPGTGIDPEHVTFRGWQGKDESARSVLSSASYLALAIAGWAVNHRAGRVLAETDASELDNNSHVHETIGRDYLSDFAPHGGDAAKMARAVVRALLEPRALLSAGGLWREVSEALHALDFGEVRPILAPEKLGKHGRPYSLASLRAGAIEYVHYLVGTGISRKRAEERVAKAFGVAHATLRSWDQRLPDIIGASEVTQRMRMAHSAGRLAALLAEDPDYASPRKGRQETIGGVEYGTHSLLAALDIVEMGQAYLRCLREGRQDDGDVPDANR